VAIVSGKFLSISKRVIPYAEHSDREHGLEVAFGKRGIRRFLDVHARRIMLFSPTWRHDECQT